MKNTLIIINKWTLREHQKKNLVIYVCDENCIPMKIKMLWKCILHIAILKVDRLSILCKQFEKCKYCASNKFACSSE